MSSPTLSAITQDLQDCILANFAICGVLGLVLNSTLLSVLVPKVKKGGSHCDIKLCLFIAIIDFIISIGLIFRSIFVKFPYNIFKEHSSWCKFELLSVGMLLVCSGYSLAVMAVERFTLICFNIKLSAYFWFSLIGLFWGIHFGFASTCAYYNLHILSKTETYCTFLVSGVCKSGYYVSLALYYTSFSAVIISYVGIMVVKFKQCLNQIHLNVPKDKVYSELRSTIAKSLINLLIFLIVFSGKLYVYTYEVVTGKKRTIELDVISLMSISYTGVANGLVLLYMNSEVRCDLFKMLKNLMSKLFNK